MSGGYGNSTVHGDSSTVVLLPGIAWMRNASVDSWFTYGLGANFTAAIPGNATAIYWNGFKSFGAGEYSLCLDCSEKDILISNNDTVQWIDGHTSNTSENAVQTIWSMTDLKARENNHVLRIRNQIDQRFGGSGLLSIDSLTITIPQPIKNSESSPTVNMPISSSSATGPLKAAIAVAAIEAALILVLLAFIILKLRRRKRSLNPPPISSNVREADCPPTTPLIVHTRASSTGTQEYDPYEELEHPGDMPRPSKTRLRLQSNVSRASSALSANSVFRSLAGMFPSTPGSAEDVRSAPVSRSASLQSRGTNLASYFDFENPPHGSLPRSPSPAGSRAQSPRPTTSAPTGVDANTNGSKESEGSSRVAVENGGDETLSPLEARRLTSFKAEVVNPPRIP